MRAYYIIHLGPTCNTQSLSRDPRKFELGNLPIGTEIQSLAMDVYSVNVLGLDGVSGCILMHVTPFDNIGTTSYNIEV